jgi:hypothetical protein
MDKMDTLTETIAGNRFHFCGDPEVRGSAGMMAA